MRMRSLMLVLLLGCGGPSIARPTTTARREPSTLREAGCFADGEALRDLTFEAKAQRRTFRQGEQIVLALSFASTAADTYQLDAATYDRSGRLDCDTFHVAEEGTADPLADFFGRGGGFAGGGLRSMPMLTAEPVRVERVLNEHVRFDQPGVYVIQVTSDRVSREAGQVECVGAPIELTITPADDAADRVAIEEAVRVLEDGHASEEAQLEAALTLRHSLSRAAVAPLVAHLARNEAVSGALGFGLFGTRYREEAATLMERALDDRDTPVPARFFDVLVTLRHWLEFPERPSPRPEDEAASAAWDAAAEERQRRYAEDASTLAARLAASRAEKSPAAERTTFSTLLEIGLRAGETPPPWFSALIGELGPRLADLSTESQERLLRSQWRDIASPELVPALITIADTPNPEGAARVLALRRLIELAPAEGRRRIEAAIRSTEIDLGYAAREALLALPPDAFGSSLDDALAVGLERHDHQRDLRAATLARYASRALVPRVRAYLEAHRDDRSSEADGHLLAYLVRVDPHRASREMAARARPSSDPHAQALAAATLETLSETAWDPALEPIAIALLASEEQRVVEGAAHALRRRGGPSAERALVSRLRALFAPWRDRSSELESHVHRGESDAARVRTLGYTLLDALTRAENFVPSPSTLDGMLAACVTDECRSTVERVRGDIAIRPVPLRVILHQGGEVEVWFVTPSWQRSSEVARVGDEGIGRVRAFEIEGQPLRPAGAPRYRAEALDWLLGRVSGLPRGTEVELASWPEQGAEIEALLESLRAWLEAHGFRMAG